MERLFEGSFDFESVSVECDDSVGIQVNIAGKEDDSSARGMLDQDESNEPSDGTPHEIDNTISDFDIAFAVDRA